ncbi:hypothetical protein IBTHAUMO2_780014 [Nitrosopumilaceae archaeon]|nr:hypothetical protein IBTHAUMO2_780014 [Nitrosopumilaceae archaeon]
MQTSTMQGSTREMTAMQLVEAVESGRVKSTTYKSLEEFIKGTEV